MLDYNDDRLFDLPLQPRSFPFGDKHNRPEERPKQIHGDAYRCPSSAKENSIRGCRQGVCNAGDKLRKEEEFRSPPQCQPAIATSGKKNRNENLRNIIKRQLFSSQKLSLKNDKPKGRAALFEDTKNKENKPINRYQQLLCQVYGDPKPKIKTSNKSAASHPSSMQRNASAKLLPIGDNKNGLERYRSATDLKQKLCLKSEVESGRSGLMKAGSPTYLQLYMQKRKPFLFL